jgi:hypothetical protein
MKFTILLISILLKMIIYTALWSSSLYDILSLINLLLSIQLLQKCCVCSIVSAVPVLPVSSEQRARAYHNLIRDIDMPGQVDEVWAEFPLPCCHYLSLHMPDRWCLLLNKPCIVLLLCLHFDRVAGFTVCHMFTGYLLLQYRLQPI